VSGGRPIDQRRSVLGVAGTLAEQLLDRTPDVFILDVTGAGRRTRYWPRWIRQTQVAALEVGWLERLL